LWATDLRARDKARDFAKLFLVKITLATYIFVVLPNLSERIPNSTKSFLLAEVL